MKIVNVGYLIWLYSHR